jgi:hypothetical protein
MATIFNIIDIQEEEGLKLKPEDIVIEKNIQKIITIEKDIKDMMPNQNLEFLTSYKTELKSTLRNNIFKREFKLPEELLFDEQNKIDSLSYLSALPKSNMENILNVAENLDMVVSPLEYIDTKNMFNGYNIQELNKSLENFKKSLSEVYGENSYNLYMISPVDYYSVWEHIKSNTNLEMFTPSSMLNIFQTLNLMIPAQMNLYQISKNNSDNISIISENINMMNKNVQNMADKISLIEKRINVIEKEQERQKLIELQKIEEERQKAFRLDPVIFAIDKGHSIFDKNVVAILGLGWGEDLPNILLEFKNLKTNNTGKIEDRIKGLQIKLEDKRKIKKIKMITEFANNFDKLSYDEGDDSYYTYRNVMICGENIRYTYDYNYRRRQYTLNIPNYFMKTSKSPISKAMILKHIKDNIR